MPKLYFSNLRTSIPSALSTTHINLSNFKQVPARLQVRSLYRNRHITFTSQHIPCSWGGKSTLRVSLELSTAFKHSVWLQLLRHSFGVTGTALSWNESVYIGQYSSPVVSGSIGVPQRSVLDALLFAIHFYYYNAFGNAS